MNEILRILWKEMTPFVKHRMAGVLALMIAAGVLTALSPVALKVIVDDLVGNRAAGVGSPLLLVMPYILSLWFARMANELRELVFGQARQRIFRTLSERLFAHLMHLPLSFHLDRQTGALCQTLDNGIEGLRVILHHLVFTFVPVTVELLTVLLVLGKLVTTPLLFLFCAALACYLVAFGYSAAAISKAARRASAARVNATSAMTDGLLNYEIVKYFVGESLVEERVAKALQQCESDWVGFYRQYALNGLMATVIFVGFRTGAVVLASVEVKHGRMTIGEFVLVNTYMLQVVRPVEMMGYAMQGLSHGIGMLEKLVQVLSEPAEAEAAGTMTSSKGAGALEFKSVCLSYGSGRPVLSKLSFRVATGRTLGIVGPSGSGKSTVVRLLMRLLEPESGVILLDQVSISNLSLKELRAAIGVVPQDTMLFNDTVRYNIAFGRRGANCCEIESAARAAQLHDFVMSLPNGYDTVVGERGVKLSGGERQRISIARAILKSPIIYVFDEATSSLDSQTESEILCSLRKLSRSNTTLVIAHRLATVVHADEIIFLEHGRVAEQGTHESLLRRKGRYAALWSAQRDTTGVAAAMSGI